jgi:DNA-binding PadR family transcriptional regulator
MPSKAGPSDLTTTSYAILGLLAIRPWTTYELAQQMGRALGQFWPRAESKLYEEPKKLVAHGLAKATPEQVGRRPRTVYTITAKGRRALAAWVPTPGAGPSLEFEGLVKVFFAEHGTKADLQATIDRVRDEVAERSVQGVEICRGYLDGEGPFPERLPWIILAGTFLDEYVEALERWADHASTIVDDWPDDVREADASWEALEEMARHATERVRRAEARRAAAIR